MEENVKKINLNSSEQAPESVQNLENELKKERSQKRWQANGEGYIGHVDSGDDKLYNQLRNYSALQKSLDADDLFWPH